MQTRVGMWGGSCAIRLPKMAVESLNLYDGEKINLNIEKGALVVRPAGMHYDLDDLIRDAKKMQAPASLDDRPQGNELL